MPELDAEHRDQLAEALHATSGYTLSWETLSEFRRATYRNQADALAPLIAGWLADAWDEGRIDAINERASSRDNPYRGGER